MEEFVPAYFDAIKREILSYAERLKEREISTIFIGGGTPSLVEPEYINELMSVCQEI